MPRRFNALIVEYSLAEQRTSLSVPAAGDYATVLEALPTPAASSDAADGAASETTSSLGGPPPERCSWPWLVWWLLWLWRKMFPIGFWRQLLDICKVSWKTVRYTRTLVMSRKTEDDARQAFERSSSLCAYCANAGGQHSFPVLSLGSAVIGGDAGGEHR